VHGNRSVCHRHDLVIPGRTRSIAKKKMERLQQDPPARWAGFDGVWRAKLLSKDCPQPLERVFSVAKIALADCGSRMDGDTIEALECLKSRQRDYISIAASRDDIKAIEDMLNALCEQDLEYIHSYTYSSRNTIAQGLAVGCCRLLSVQSSSTIGVAVPSNVAGDGVGGIQSGLAEAPDGRIILCRTLRIRESVLSGCAS